MDTKTDGSIEQNRGAWAWPGPAGLYIGLIFAGASFFAERIWGRDSFPMDLLVALLICSALVYHATRRGNVKWRSYYAWVLRIAFGIIAWWVYRDAPTALAGAVAVLIFLVAYALCERAVWRRVRADQNRSNQLRG